jgi:hypothetical protein
MGVKVTLTIEGGDGQLSYVQAKGATDEAKSQQVLSPIWA